VLNDLESSLLPYWQAKDGPAWWRYAAPGSGSMKKVSVEFCWEPLLGLFVNGKCSAIYRKARCDPSYRQKFTDYLAELRFRLIPKRNFIKVLDEVSRWAG
jgi:hypothetical protein